MGLVPEIENMQAGLPVGAEIFMPTLSLALQSGERQISLPLNSNPLVYRCIGESGKPAL